MPQTWDGLGTQSPRIELTAEKSKPKDVPGASRRMKYCTSDLAAQVPAKKSHDAEEHGEKTPIR